MGLDQYLYATKYLENNGEGNEFTRLVETVNAESFIDSNNRQSLEVKALVGTWRKAYQIHGWFVRNVQHDEDNNLEYYVRRDSLTELLELCYTVKSRKGKPEEQEIVAQYLPSFDDLEVDEVYWQQIDSTIKQLESLLVVVPDGWEFSYQGSW